MLEPLPTTVVTDPEPGGNPWRTYLHCLHQLPDTGHVLIVQDDAQPCRNLPAAVEQIAAHVPDVPVVLFTPGICLNTKRHYREAQRRRQPYVQLVWRDILPVVAVLWPVDVAARFREWALENPGAPGGRSNQSDDAKAHCWMKRGRERVLCTVPSLVEHDDRIPSLIRDRGDKRHGTDGRRALAFIGDNDPARIDWTVR